MAKVINQEEYKQKYKWQCQLTTVGGAQIKNELWYAFTNDTNKRIKIHGIDVNDLDDLNTLEKWLNGFIINLDRPLMALKEIAPNEYELRLFLIKEKDPENYYRIASNLVHNLSPESKNFLDNLDKLISLALNNFNPTSHSRLEIQQRQKELHHLLENGKIVSIKKVPLLLSQNEDTHRNSGQQIWYLSKTRGLLSIQKTYKLLSSLSVSYSDDMLSVEDICAGHLIDKFVAEHDVDTYVPVMEINHSSSSSFSLPIVYQHKRLGIHGRTTPYYLYNVIAHKLDSAHYVLTNLQKMREFHFIPNIKFWRIRNEELMDGFMSDYLSRREMDERRIEIEKVRTYEKGESIIAIVQRGRYHYYYEVVLEPAQKEYLKNGGEPDGIL